MGRRPRSGERLEEALRVGDVGDLDAETIAGAHRVADGDPAVVEAEFERAGDDFDGERVRISITDDFLGRPVTR